MSINQITESAFRIHHENSVHATLTRSIRSYMVSDMALSIVVHACNKTKSAKDLYAELKAVKKMLS